MNLQMTLEKETRAYVVETLHCTITERLLWGEGGVLYSVITGQGERKSLFATSLMGAKIKRRSLYETLVHDSKNDAQRLIRCEHMAWKEVVAGQEKRIEEKTAAEQKEWAEEHPVAGRKEQAAESPVVGYYIFILMEPVIPLIELVLDEKYCGADWSENHKKYQLLTNMIEACDCVQMAEQNYPQINLFIHNEQLCVDEMGQTKLLLFDLIKNDIELNNQAAELKLIMKRLASGIGIKDDMVGGEFFKIQGTQKDHLEMPGRELQEGEGETLGGNRKSAGLQMSGRTQEDTHLKMLKQSWSAMKDSLKDIETGYREKFTQNMEAAQKGNPAACCNLGYMYEHGRGVNVDYEKARSWYEKAAMAGDVRALNNLAHLYQKGYGVKKDYRQAITYLMKAAKYNDAMAQFNLGIVYQTGKGTPADKKQAMYWYKKAMKNGNAVAGRMYARLQQKAQ